MHTEKQNSEVKTQTTTLLKLIREESKTVSDIANSLGVATTQIYKWNREGIKETCKHYEQLKKLIPNLEPAEERITAKGEPDRRSQAGVKPKELVLTETDLPEIKEKLFKSTLFPRIIFKKK